MDTLAKRVKAARLRIEGMRQEDLAEKSGLKQADISKIENGRILKTTGVVAMARALGVDAHWLATGEGSATPDKQLTDWPLKTLSYAQFVALPEQFHAAVENFAQPYVKSSQTPVQESQRPPTVVTNREQKGFVFVDHKLRVDNDGTGHSDQDERTEPAPRKSAGHR